MRKNFGAKPFLYPQPVMILGTYDENGKANAMNAAWGGIVGANEIIADLSAVQVGFNLYFKSIAAPAHFHRLLHVPIAYT